MATRNSDRYLDRCLDSIAAQTLRDFELVIIDDGSRDRTRERLAARSRRDPRIRVHRSTGRGLVHALNQGLALCRSPIVARMDSDDRMRPERLRRQRAYLDAHPGVDVVGARVRAFPKACVGAGMREYLRWQNARLTPRSMADDIYLESPLTQPSVTFRRDVVIDHGGYRDGDFPEDYELWLRLAQAGRRFGKCAEELLLWRQRADSYSRTDPRFSRDAFDRLRARYLCRDPRLGQGRPLAFWGAGRVTRKRCRHLISAGHAPTVWIDIDPKKIGARIGGAPVVSPDWLAGRQDGPDRPLVLVYVARHGARELIGRRLDHLGYLRGQDYLMVG